MKTITYIALPFITLFILSACKSSGEPTPTQNSALNTISPSNTTKKSGAMQNSLDSWLHNDWTPNVAKDQKIQQKYMKKKSNNPTKAETKKEEKLIETKNKTEYTEDKERNFTLQEYVDKASVYIKAHEGDKKTPSHKEKMDQMPVIGK